MPVDSRALAERVRQTLRDWVAAGGVGFPPHVEWPGCEHVRQEMRIKVTTAGSRMVQTQCLECGCRLGGLSIREAERRGLLDTLPPFDDSLWPAYSRRRDAFHKWQLEQRLACQPAGEEAWRRGYEEHLRSDRWRELRRLVLARAGGVCEGCGLARAVQVHHIVYPTQYGRGWGQEMLWELRAVCLACHEAVTAGQSTQKGTVA